MFAAAPRWEVLPHTLPLENALRLELREGVPIFRAAPRIQNRIEALLEKQQVSSLSAVEKGELKEYEELDDFLSLVNRLVRNLVQGNGADVLHAPAA